MTGFSEKNKVVFYCKPCWSRVYDLFKKLYFPHSSKLEVHRINFMQRLVRLSEEQEKAIKECAREAFGENVKVYLFGSRVKPEKKGGDIDLMVETHMSYVEFIDRSGKFLHLLFQRIGEQKVDLVYYNPEKPQRLIHRIAMQEGVVL